MPSEEEKPDCLEKVQNQKPEDNRIVSFKYCDLHSMGEMIPAENILNQLFQTKNESIYYSQITPEATSEVP